jgi:signal transduction histidine kinase
MPSASARHQATLEDVLITHELISRPRRPASPKAEAAALHKLARTMATAPNDLPDTLLELAVELCEADTAGLSLLETTPAGERVFRWTNLSGALRAHVGGSTPRNFSPCGVCLDRKTSQLFKHPERFFDYFNAVGTPFVEALVVPLVPIGNDPLGTIWILSHRAGKVFDSEDVRIMSSIADFTSVALLLFRTLDAERQNQSKLESLVKDRTSELVQLSAHLLRAQDEERRRIARELHDSLGQNLAVARMYAETLKRETKTSGSSVLLKTVSDLTEIIDMSMAETRTMAYLLHPPLLREKGLQSAVRGYVRGFAERSGIQIELEISPEIGRMPEAFETAAFRVIQESLTNIHRHSESNKAAIRVSIRDGVVMLQVTDQGKGIQTTEEHETHMGVGISGMRERMRLLNGTLFVDSDGPGTTIRASFPYIEASN